MPWPKGRKQTTEHRAKNSAGVRAAKLGVPRPPGFQDGPKHWRWKGEDVGYVGLHSWIQRHKGKASDHPCSFNCGRQARHWANISHEYHRDLNDFMALCPPCHIAYDSREEVKT